ncbi:hypothetical protein OHC33_000912 [Knufia fluminis]|uniref:Clr5 domain-containing protein n=1 Tax=Knufia fluminis TaxID=191047 RepID=A0AAN8EL02_9EURO|nr:hypothetical protein OHC33_000912 [Knufia fluminis]
MGELLFKHVDPAKGFKRNKAPVIADSIWETVREEIEWLVKFGVHQNHILTVLRENHNLDATSRQLWVKLHAWGLTRPRSTRIFHGSMDTTMAAYDMAPPVAITGIARPTTLEATGMSLSAKREEIAPLVVYTLPTVQQNEKHAVGIENSEVARERIWKCTTCTEGLRDWSVSSRVHRLRAICTRDPGAPHRQLGTDTALKMWIWRYGQLLELTREWLSESESLTLHTLSWIYLLVYELAFSTAIASRYAGGRSILDTYDSRLHLEAAARLLTRLTHQMDEGADLSWFISVYKEFNHRLREYDKIEGKSATPEKFWREGPVLLFDDANPRVLKTRSLSYLLSMEDG